MKNELDLRWLWIAAIPLIIAAALIWGKKHDEGLRWHPVKDSINFDTLHSEIKPIDTLIL